MVIVFGSINADVIVQVPKLPEPGETVRGTGLRIEAGGKGANQALAAARDGARVVLAGAIGADPPARTAMVLLEHSSVDLSRVAVVASATGLAAITVDPAGRNQIAIAPGANDRARASQVEDALLGPGATLLLQMEVNASEVERLLRRAKVLGARTILNLAPPEPLAAEVLALADILLVNEGEARALAERLDTASTPTAIAQRLGIGVVKTLGAAGVEAEVAGCGFRIPARSVAVRDTTAAGDCFAGVLAAALDRGQSMESALRRAVVAAGIACTREGSGRSLPEAAEIDAALTEE